MTFKEDIALMIQKQKELDQLILAKKKLKEYPLDKMNCGLFCELGELLQEVPAEFKYWKDSAVNNLEKALVEYVDCVHILISLYIYERKNAWFSLNIPEYNGVRTDLYYESFTLIQLPNGVSSPCASIETRFAKLWAIGKHLKFTWEQVYDVYMKKNAVNIERIERGY